MKFFPVPGCYTAFLIVGAASHHCIGLVKHLVLSAVAEVSSVPVLAARFRSRNCIAGHTRNTCASGAIAIGLAATASGNSERQRENEQVRRTKTHLY